MIFCRQRDGTGHKAAFVRGEKKRGNAAYVPVALLYLMPM